MKLSALHLNPDNPRFIKDEKFEKLKKSIKESPKFMELRPITYDETGMILGGNMRFRACQELGFADIPDGWVRQASDLSEDEKKKFIIIDNAGFGEWDYDKLANEWDSEKLKDWGVDVPEFDAEDDEGDGNSAESFDFTIKCSNPDELDKLQTKLNAPKKSMSCNDFLLKIGL